MGELEVWVNGVINTISGLDDSTTCKDTVIALAQSFGLIGRFNLVEKSPTSERPLHPNECPLKIREKWGHGSANYFVLRKRVASPSSSRPSSASSSSQSSPSHGRYALKSPETISEGGTGDKHGDPPVIKPKPKPKPVLPSGSKHSLPTRPDTTGPTTVPRNDKSSLPPKAVEDVQVEVSQERQLSHRPDLLMKAPSHATPGDSEGERRAREEEEIMKQHEERAEVMERERQRLQQVEKALDEKRKQRTLKASRTDMAVGKEGEVVTEQQRILQGFKKKQEESSHARRPEKEGEKGPNSTEHSTERAEHEHRMLPAGKEPGEDVRKKKKREKKETGHNGKKGHREESQRHDREEDDHRSLNNDEKRQLEELVRAQGCQLNHQRSQLTGLDAAIQALLRFESDPAIDTLQMEIDDIERAVQRNQAMLDEREFWENELELEREVHRKLETSVGVLKDKVADCNRQISQKSAEISELSEAIGQEERKLGLDDARETEEVRAVREELRGLEEEYEAITENLNKASEKLEALDAEFQEKQRELDLVTEDYERAAEVEIIIADDRTETEEGDEDGEDEREEGTASPSLYRILKSNPRELAQATPTSDNPEGVFL